MSALNSDRTKGFTLIELLLVVAIIGILAAILFPILQGAIQKAKQKGSMTDMNTLGKAIMTYTGDMGRPPANPNGPLQAGQQFIVDLDALHLAAIPYTDHWGNPFRIWTGNAVAGHFGIAAPDVGGDDYLIQSLGRDGADEGFVYSSSDPQGYYSMNTIGDFDKDLILWGGNWIRAPRAAQTGT